MNHIPHALKLGAALFVLAMFAGGANAQQNSGFLSDYSKLAPAADNPDTLLWVSKDFDFKPYRKILLDKVEIFVSPTSEYKGVSPDVFKGMADRFTASVKKAFGPRYQFVDKPGPDVLRIRLAITGVNLVKPPFNLANVIPVVFILRTVLGSNETRNVALTVETEVRGPDDNVVAEGLRTGTGDTGVSPGQQVTWQDVQRLTDTWARNLRQRLDEARGVTTPS